MTSGGVDDACSLWLIELKGSKVKELRYLVFRSQGFVLFYLQDDDDDANGDGDGHSYDEPVMLKRADGGIDR
jgi:hypothetical protein